MNNHFDSPLSLLTAQQVRVVDALAVHQGISVEKLMSRAGAEVALQVQRRWSRRPVTVLCGPGNNGGDGLVAAAELKHKGWPVTVALFGAANPLSSGRWDGASIPCTFACIEGAGLVIDALFGVGLDREIAADLLPLFAKIEQQKIPVLAVDIPSGIEGNTGQVLGAALKAEVTVTFARKKPGQLLLPGRLYCGEVVVADIGIPADTYARLQPNLFENGPGLWREVFPVPDRDSNKYVRGALLIAGGAQMTGATRLAARAAQRAGAGLVTLAVPQEAAPVYAADLASCIIRPMENDSVWPNLLETVRHDALLIGPGYGRAAATKRHALQALALRKPVVLDADALTVFAEAPQELLSKLHQACVLTPHEGEFARLFKYEGDALRRASLAAVTSGAVVVLKGAATVIAAPDGRCIINSNAPPDLATAGAGDVLAGIIAGLLAQGMPPYEAAAAGVWLHGEAARHFGPGLIAEDIAAQLPGVLTTLFL
jgi:hydroxyethylthiazole kinase-like uncharacterized protein yjeF